MNFSWLNLQYPFEETYEEKRNTVLALSVSTGLILILLQPYGFSLTDQSLHFIVLILIGALTMSVNYFILPSVFPSFFEESHWSIAKAMLFLGFNFLNIGCWNHLYQVVFVEQNIFLISSTEQLWAGLSKTVAIGLVASGFLVLIRYNILTRRHLQIAQELNDNSRQELAKEIPSGSKTVLLLLDGQEMQIDRNDLLLISAEGNYVSLKVRGQIKSPLYRATIKQVEASLAGYPEFFRCHRSHVINLNVISSLKGNSQGLFVQVDNHAEKIPVARPKIKWLRNAIHQKSHFRKQFVTN